MSNVPICQCADVPMPIGNELCNQWSLISGKGFLIIFSVILIGTLAHWHIGTLAHWQIGTLSNYFESNIFTIVLIVFPSAFPASCFVAAPITFPISAGELAPVSAIIF